MGWISLKQDDQDPLAQWDGHPPDANNEFMPHAGRMNTSAYSSIRRISRVYRRVTIACWNTTPPNATDIYAVALSFCRPRT